MGTGDQDDTLSHPPHYTHTDGRGDRLDHDKAEDRPARALHEALTAGGARAGTVDTEGRGVSLEMKPLVEDEDPAGPNHKAADGDGDDDDDDTANVKEVEEEDESHLLQDRGWAWFVCLSCFVSHLITGGFERSDGVLFLEFTDRFRQGAQITAWPGAICSTIRLCMGPVATAVCNRFSARTSVMCGSFIFATGVIVSGLAPNVVFLYFSYGVLQGIGRGLIYAPGLVIVGMYFNRRRGVGVGLGTAGVGAGTFPFQPFGIGRGLIYAPGLVIVGMYFNRRRGVGVGLGTAGVGAGTFAFPPFVEWLFQYYGFRGAFLILGAVALNSCVVAALFRPLFVHRNIVLGSRQRAARDEEKALYTPPASHHHEDKPEPRPPTPEDAPVSPDPNHPPPAASHKRRKSTGAKTTGCLKSAFAICFPTEAEKKDAPKRKLIEWTLLKNTSFLFYCLSICLFTAAFKSAFTFLPALAKSRGVAVSDAAYLLSVSGIFDTVGRILAGFVLDIECVRPFRPIIYNSVIFVITCLSFMSPYMTDFVQFAVLFGFYGMLTGTYVSQKSVILVDILGKEKLSSSFGLMICFQGIGTFIGPPLSGLLKDVFGRYHEAFFLGGSAMAVAGLLMVVSNICRVVKQRRAAHKQQ